MEHQLYATLKIDMANNSVEVTLSEPKTQPYGECCSYPCAAKLSMSNLCETVLAHAEKERRLLEKLKTLGVKIE